MMDRESLSEWAKDKPLSILQLDPADRAVLRIAGEWMLQIYCISLCLVTHFVYFCENIVDEIDESSE